MIIPFAHGSLELLPEKAIWLEELRLLCIADLHFEKDSFFAAKSTFLPPYGSLETLQKLQQIIMRLQPDIVIAAGDSFHDKNAGLRMPPGLISDLNQLIDGVHQWHWLSGNHDPAIADTIHGLRSADLSYSGITFRHQATKGTHPEISGHYHPKARFSIRGHFFSVPCFVQHVNRFILPSFGQYTGGLDINSAAFLNIAPQEERKVFVIHENQVFRQ
jgi:DNA ligase-associated metallophosphoesterase